MARKGILPDDAPVVRCGKPPFEFPKPLYERCDEHESYYGFSVQCSPGRAIYELAAWCSNNKIGWTTVGAIRSAGYDVVMTRGDGFHATVTVPRDWEAQGARSLALLFVELSNPIPKAGRLR